MIIIATILAILSAVFFITVIIALVKVASEDDEEELLRRMEMRIERQTEKELMKRANNSNAKDDNIPRDDPYDR